MAGTVFTELNHVTIGMDPVADFNDGTVYSDIVNLRNYHHVTFFRYQGVGTTGTATLTVEACDDVTPSNTTAVAYKYRIMTANDTWGALTAVASTGFATAAGSSSMWAIEVDAQDIVAAGYGYARLKMVEVANDPVLGGIMIILSKARVKEDVHATVIT